MGEANWQPIETAPKNGTRFLAWSEAEGVYLTGWRTGVGSGYATWFSDQYRDMWQDYPVFDRPTHWMPLPSPPLATPEPEGGAE